MRVLVLINISLQTKFELPIFTHSKDMMGNFFLKYWSRDHDHAHLRVSCHPMANT